MQMRGDSEYYDDNDQMFNPDCYNPDEKLFDSEDEGYTEKFDFDAVVNFWATNKNGIIIRELVANSVQSLERITPSSELKKALKNALKTGANEWDKHIIRIVTNKKMKTLSIIDNGAGMTKEELEYYGSSSGRGLLSVADKVVIKTKHHKGNGDEEYVMELSHKEEEEDNNKKIVVATEKDKDLLYLGSTRGTKITLFLKQQDHEVEFGYLQERTTFEVLVNMFFSTIYYRIFVVGIEAEEVKVVGWTPYTRTCYETNHDITSPIVFT